MLGPRAALFAGLVFAAILSGSVARAQDEGSPPEAVEFYRLAREHYEAGQYRDAADDLERALMLDPDSPTLVYNLARVYELLGEPVRALQRYEQYQRLLPQQQAREQERAAATIRRLEGAAASATPEAPPPPREVAPLRQLPGLVLVRENGVADAAFWGVLIGGAVSLAIGGVLAGVALDRRGQVDGWVLGPASAGGDGSAADQASAHEEARFLGLGADVALGVGGVAVVAAGLLYFVRDHTVERAPVRAVEDDEAGSAEARGPQIAPIFAAGASGAFVGMAGRL